MGLTILAITGAVLGVCTAASASASEPQPPEIQTSRPQAAEPDPQPATVAPPLTQEARTQAIKRLARRHKEWLESVIGLITQFELDYFLRLEEDFRRDVFMGAFWDSRDPDPKTSINELETRWKLFKARAGGLPYSDPRFLLYLLHGIPDGWALPDGRRLERCFSAKRELEIWFYGWSERVERRFAVILQRRATGSHYEIYQPGENVLRPIQRRGGLPVKDVAKLCTDDDVRYAESESLRHGDYGRLLDRVFQPPVPSLESLATLAASATDPPPGAESFEVDVELRFPTRNQSRTGVQVLFSIDRRAAPGRRFDGELYHNFLLVGEVIRDGRLFETFRYRFEGPTPEDAVAVPLGFTRFLRSGEADLRLLLEDLYTKRYAQVVRRIDVPSPDLVTVDVPQATTDGEAEHALRLLQPIGSVHSGLVRFRSRHQGHFDRVAFFLDDRLILNKMRPPYSVELDLGPRPVSHRVRVVGFAGDREMATDQIWVNQGTQNFRVRLIEPRPGGIYPGSLTARVAVETPDGRPPERLELYLDDEPVETLREPPFAHTLRLRGDGLAVVRAIAYLRDGKAAEDAVVVNASPFADAIDVRLVELPTLVTDPDGRAILDLERADFRVFENGVAQDIRRFELLRDAPVRTALLLDRSASMAAHLDRVTGAARAFLSAALRSEDDRVAVLSFAERATMDAGFTASAGQLERALAGLVPYGRTALYDSLVQTLNTFDGAPGETALIVFSDGRDETSRLSFEQTLDTARRAGITIYPIGLREAFEEKPLRRMLEQLAEETGGQAYFLDRLDDLGAAYGAILDQLRSRYLLAYEPRGTIADADYRAVRVDVDRRGARVRTRRGYSP